MCDPVTAAVIGVASAGAQYMGQRKQAKQQARYQAQASAAERQRALQEQSAVRMRQAQEEIARKTELGHIKLQSREAQKTALTAAGDRNVTGVSLDALLDNFVLLEAQHAAMSNQQGEWDHVQTGLALDDAGFRSRSNLININRYVPRESALTATLKAANAGLSGARTGLDIQRAMGGGSSSISSPSPIKSTLNRNV